MKIRTAQVVRLSLFCITGLACASFVANTLSVPVRGDTESYSFEFTDVEGLNPGNPVTLSGVESAGWTRSPSPTTVVAQVRR